MTEASFPHAVPPLRLLVRLISSTMHEYEKIRIAEFELVESRTAEQEAAYNKFKARDISPLTNEHDMFRVFFHDTKLMINVVNDLRGQFITVLNQLQNHPFLIDYEASKNEVDAIASDVQMILSATFGEAADKIVKPSQYQKSLDGIHSSVQQLNLCRNFVEKLDTLADKLHIPLDPAFKLDPPRKAPHRPGPL